MSRMPHHEYNIGVLMWRGNKNRKLSVQVGRLQADNNHCMLASRRVPHVVPDLVAMLVIGDVALREVDLVSRLVMGSKLDRFTLFALIAVFLFMDRWILKAGRLK